MRGWICLAWSAVCGAPLVAQDPLESRLRADLEVLTSLAAEGREVGTRGGRFAERFLAARLAEIGLAPGGADGFRQPFTVEDPRPAQVDRASTALVLTVGDTVERFELGRDFAPFTGSAEGHGAARLVPLGYAFGTASGDAPHAEVGADAVVGIVLRGAPAGSSLGSRAPDTLRFATKLRIAVAAGARAVLLFDPDERSPEESIRNAGLAQGASPIPVFWITRPVAVRLFDALGVGIDRAVGPAGVTAGRDAARSAPEVRIDFGVRFVGARTPRHTANVIGRIPGRDPRLRDEFVVIGAHHDHIGRGAWGSLAPTSDGLVHPGADDNASGCAALLATAARLNATPAPRRTIVFVAFGAEESGLRGSEFLLESDLLPTSRIVTMINLNMVGRAQAGRLRIEGVGSGKGLDAVVRAAVEEVGHPVELRAVAAARSDHAAFLARGVPAVLITAGLHDAYHTPADTIATVSAPDLLGVARLAAALVRGLAESDSRPRFAADGSARAGTGR